MRTATSARSLARSLAPDRVRVERSLADLLMDIDRVGSASELGAYISPLPSGLHILGAPSRRR